MRILLLDFIKKRPWLDLDNGELCGILKKYEIIVENHIRVCCQFS